MPALVLTNASALVVPLIETAPFDPLAVIRPEFVMVPSVVLSMLKPVAPVSVPELVIVPIRVFNADCRTLLVAET